MLQLLEAPLVLPLELHPLLLLSVELLLQERRPLLEVAESVRLLAKLLESRGLRHQRGDALAELLRLPRLPLDGEPSPPENQGYYESTCSNRRCRQVIPVLRLEAR